MKNEYIKEIIALTISSSKYKITLVFLIIGTYMAIRISPSGRAGYVDTIIYCLSNIKYLTFIIIPSFVLMTLHNYKMIEKKYFFYQRLESRKGYFLLQLKTNGIIISSLYLITILIILIFANLYNSGKVIEINEVYNIANIIICFYWIFKVAASIVIFSFMNLLLYKLYSGLSSILLTFLFLFSIFAVSFNPIINTMLLINPLYYLVNSFSPNSFILHVFITFTYYLSFLGVLYVITKKIIIKRDVLTEGKL